MAKRRVRIYNGETADAQLIGFSMSADDAPDQAAFKRFMKDRGYSWEKTSARPPKGEGVSYAYVEVRPPLSPQHMQEFGQLCVGGVIDGQRVEAIVDPYHDGTLVYDNRIFLPRGPLGGGGLIAEC